MAIISIFNCTFIDNLATEGSAVYVSPLFFNEIQINIDSCSFNNKGESQILFGNETQPMNIADSINEANSEIVIDTCLFDKSIFLNSVALLNECGGGIHFGNHYPNEKIVSSIINCSFNLNNATNGGALCFTSSYKAYIESCIFDHNSAMKGGGIYVTTQYASDILNLTIYHCKFESNSADEGSAIYLDGKQNDEIYVLYCLFISENEKSNLIYTNSNSLNIQNVLFVVNQTTTGKFVIKKANNGSITMINSQILNDISEMDNNKIYLKYLKEDSDGYQKEDSDEPKQPITNEERL